MSARQLLEVGSERQWVSQANCLGSDPRMFFPESSNVAEAQAVCHGCLVREQCLQYALDSGERFGVWGGLSERQRSKLRRARARRRVPGATAPVGRGGLANPGIPTVAVHPADSTARATVRRLARGGSESYLRRAPIDLESLDHVFVVRADDIAVGYAVVRPGDPTRRHSLGAFAVMRKYAGRGVAQLAARDVLRRYEGAWELLIQPDQAHTLVFWRAAVPAVVEEDAVDDGIRVRFRIRR